MKKILFLFIMAFISQNSIADTYYFAWDGYGLATRCNYGLGYGYGTYQYKGIANGLGIGTMEINQNYDLFYNEEKGSSIGSSMHMKLNYYFISPMVVFQLSKSGQTQCYVTGGVGDLQGGSAELHKWSRNAWTQGGAYDSIIDQSATVSALVFRFGFGLTQFYHLGGNFHLFINEDFGFVTTPMLNISDPENAQLKTNTSQIFQPFYSSLRIGLVFITHSRDNRYPYKIYR